MTSPDQISPKVDNPPVPLTSTEHLPKAPPPELAALIENAVGLFAMMHDKENSDKQNERQHQLQMFKEQVVAEDKRNHRESRLRWGILGAGVLVILIGGAFLLFKSDSATASAGKELITMALLGIFAFWAGGSNKGQKSEPPESTP